LHRKRNIYISDDDIYKIDYSKNIYNALIRLKSGCGLSDISMILGEERALDFISTLKEMKLIKTSNKNFYKNTMVEKQVEYLYSLIDDGNIAQDKIENATVAIVGVGGIGSVALQHLVAAGIGSFILVDGDDVNIDNFNRQLIYSFKQIGKSKVDAAKEYIVGHNKDAKVITIKQFIQDETDLIKLDDYHIYFMICGADKPYKKIQKIISSFCKVRNIPSTYGMVGINFGNWGPIICPTIDRDYSEFQAKFNEEMNEDERIVYNVNDNEPLSASFGLTNTIVAAYMTFDVIKYIIGAEVRTGVMYSIDFNKLEICQENINV